MFNVKKTRRVTIEKIDFVHVKYNVSNYIVA